MPVADNLVYVVYGNYDFPNIGTPFVSRSQEVVYYGDKWCQVTNISLNGTLIGNYSEVKIDRDEIIEAFSEDFKSLLIKEYEEQPPSICVSADSSLWSVQTIGSDKFIIIDSSIITASDWSSDPSSADVVCITVSGIQVEGTAYESGGDLRITVSDFSDFEVTPKPDILVCKGNCPDIIAKFDNCIVTSTNFDSFTIGAQNFTIDLQCYNQDTFQGTFGILNPRNSFSYKELDNGLVDVTHSVSAMGFKKGSDSAMTEALNFVDARTGMDSILVAPKFMAGVTASNLVLKNLSRNVNRVDSIYSVEESYTVQTGDIDGVALTNGFVTEISTSVSSGFANEYSTISVSYSVQGDKYATEASVRNAAPDSGVLYDIANSAFSSNLPSKRPFNFKVTDDASTSKKVSVQCDFTDNDFEDVGDAFFDFQSSVSTDNITDVTSVSVQGEFKSIGPLINKYETISGFFYDTIAPVKGGTGYLFDIAESIYDGLSLSNDLNPLYKSLNVKDDPINGTISLEGSFDDSDFAEGFFDASYDVNVTPALQKYATRASCNKNGLYGVYNLGLTSRELTSINASFSAATRTTDYRTTVSTYVDTLRNNFVIGSDLLVNGESIDETESPYLKIDFNYEFSTENTSLI